jgi:hypothetical protein
LKDVDPRVFTRIATDGSVTIYPRNFVGEGITNCYKNGHRSAILFSEKKNVLPYDLKPHPIYRVGSVMVVIVW